MRTFLLAPSRHVLLDVQPLKFGEELGLLLLISLRLEEHFVDKFEERHCHIWSFFEHETLNEALVGLLVCVLLL